MIIAYRNKIDFEFKIYYQPIVFYVKMLIKRLKQ